MVFENTIIEFQKRRVYTLSEETHHYININKIVSRFEGSISKTSTFLCFNKTVKRFSVAMNDFKLNGHITVLFFRHQFYIYITAKFINQFPKNETTSVYFYIVAVNYHGPWKFFICSSIFYQVDYKFIVCHILFLLTIFFLRKLCSFSLIYFIIIFKC